MNPLSFLKLGGALLGLLAIASMAWLAKDRFHQKELADDAKACGAVAFKTTGDLDRCLPNVRSAILEYRQAETCDAALVSPLPSTSRFAIQQACSTEVKTIVAQRDARANELGDVQRRLAEQKQSIVKAVSRAEARAAAQSERKINANDAIKAAPRTDDGLLRCDADCLRNIGG